MPPINPSKNGKQKSTESFAGQRTVLTFLEIPEKILLPIAQEMKLNLKTDPDKWVDHCIETIRARCGPDYVAVPICDIRAQCCNLRKAKKLPKTCKGAHGASKIGEDGIPTQLSPELIAHYQSPEYRRISNLVIQRAEGRCQICNAPATECHHRTYERAGTPDEIKDLIATCRECHKVLDKRRRKQARQPKKRRQNESDPTTTA